MRRESLRVDSSVWRRDWVAMRWDWTDFMEAEVEAMRWWLRRRARRTARGESGRGMEGGSGVREVKADVMARSWARWTSWSEDWVRGGAFEAGRNCVRSERPRTEEMRST
jgi:hypothetical protein